MTHISVFLSVTHKWRDEKPYDNALCGDELDEYGPYGESGALSGTSFGFTGQRYDAESGLYNYKSRYYSPSIGRFLQPDVIGYFDTLNLYAYTGNQPTNFIDALGLASEGGEASQGANGEEVAWDLKSGTSKTYDPQTGQFINSGEASLSRDAFDSRGDTDFLDRQPMPGENEGAAYDKAIKENSYDVRKGDTLWDISAKQLGDPTRWGEIYAMNRVTIGSDPGRITPGQHLNLPVPGSSLIGP